MSGSQSLFPPPSTGNGVLPPPVGLPPGIPLQGMQPASLPPPGVPPPGVPLPVPPPGALAIGIGVPPPMAPISTGAMSNPAGGVSAPSPLSSSMPQLNFNHANAAQLVVLTHLPPFLRGIRILRDAAFPCGSARTVHLGCCAPASNEERRRMKERGLPVPLISSSTEKNGESDCEEKLVLKALKWGGAEGGVAVIKMGHFHGAKNFSGGLLELVNSGGKVPVEFEPNVVITGEESENGNVPGEVNLKVVGEGECQPKDDIFQPTPGPDKNPDQSGDSDDKSSPVIKEHVEHKETLRQIENMGVYHLSNYHIPDPPPLDLKIPSEDTGPQDPTCVYRLLEALTTLRVRYEESLSEPQTDQTTSTSSGTTLWGGHAAAATGTENESSNGGDLKFDKDKAAAAAGGGAYDEDADPLNAPEVVNSVLAFKRRLEERDVKSRKRRIDIITDKMEKKVKEVLEKMKKEREMLKKSQEKEGNSTGDGGSTIPLENGTLAQIEDTGRRGVSNLPAWMTRDAKQSTEIDTASTPCEPKPNEIANEVTCGKKRKIVLSEANRDVSIRKPRLNVEGDQSLSVIRAANQAADKASEGVFTVKTRKEDILSTETKFPILSALSFDVTNFLRKYITDQIIDYLGEEESTLIDFIMKALSKEGGCKTKMLMEEMKEVLEEDAEDFVLGLYKKTVELLSG